MRLLVARGDALWRGRDVGGGLRSVGLARGHGLGVYGMGVCWLVNECMDVWWETRGELEGWFTLASLLRVYCSLSLMDEI